jgi:putative transposase
LLREAFGHVRSQFPFSLDAFVLLPDHLHCIWTLPEGDFDFSKRWRLIKSYFSRRCGFCGEAFPLPSRQDKEEKIIWQRRFWEHKIRNQEGFARHIDYIHYNPVKHGYVPEPKDWQYSSFHKHMKTGIYKFEFPIDRETTLIPNVGKE